MNHREFLIPWNQYILHPPGISHCEIDTFKSSGMKSGDVSVSWSRRVVQFIPSKPKVFFFLLCLQKGLMGF